MSGAASSTARATSHRSRPLQTIADVQQNRHSCEMTSALYTLLCEYGGGSYLSQTYASDQHSALVNWAQGFAPEGISSDVSSEIVKSAFEVRDGNEEDITPVDGLVGVWCWTTVVANELALLTIVQSS